ncbi:MAG: flagellar motor protein MotB [Alphaproteobacteria bacterium]|jgi:chemotaxis protein MotB
MAGGKGEGEKPILIIKKKGHGDHGHHGGAWKVAYADFVTAMMAFFLLLWLLNVTTEEQRLGIANYFMPDSVSRSQSGGGGVLGGVTISPGEMEKKAAGLVLAIPRAPDASEAETAQDVDGEGKPPERRDPRDPADRVLDASKDKDKDKDGDISERRLKEQLARQEEESFRKAEFELKQAIEDIPDLKQLAENLIVDRTPEGLRIQIVDQGKYSMFPLGSAAPMDHTRKLMNAVARIVQRLPNRISVTGHTDALQFQNNSRNYGNWELSADRANSSRRMLLEAGLPTERINRVIGKAEQEPLFAENPNDPRNRRISIVLLRDNQSPQPAN